MATAPCRPVDHHNRIADQVQLQRAKMLFVLFVAHAAYVENIGLVMSIQTGLAHCCHWLTGNSRLSFLTGSASFSSAGVLRKISR